MLTNTILLKMGNKLLLVFYVLLLMISCNDYLPGFDFKLFKNTPVWKLAKAVEDDDEEKINELLRGSSTKVDYQESEYGNTLLMLAVANGKKKSVEALLKNGANPNLVSKMEKNNSVIIACEYHQDNCDTSILHLLYKYGGDLNFIHQIDRFEPNGMHTIIKNTPLMISASYDCLPIVQFLIENGANINLYTLYDGYGAITESLLSDNLSIAKYLIIDKKARIPSYIFIRPADIAYKGAPEKHLTITDLLNERQYVKGSKKYKLREEIIAYLKSKNLK